MRSALLVACVLFVAGCDDPLQVQLQAASVCQHLTGQKFVIPDDVRAQVAMLPPELQHGVSVSRTFDFDVKAKLPPELKDLVDSHVALTSIRITAAQGSADLGFVDEAHVTLQPAAGTGLTERQFDYVRTEAAPRTVEWQGDAFDVAAYLESGNLKYLVTLVGTLPAGDVVVDIDACAAASVDFTYVK
ncbi:MAG: hypothetical protein U0228_02060 [Myxococcaceae bacterium]